MLNAYHPIASAKKHRISVGVFFFIAGFTFATWASRIPQIQAKLGLSEAALGSVLLALPIGLMISLLLAGGTVQKFGSRRVVIFAAILYGTLLPFLGLARTKWELVLVLFAFGMAGNLFNIAVNTQAVGVEKLYGRSILASFHGIWSLAGFSGAAMGILLANLNLLPWQHYGVASCIGFALMAIFYANTLPADQPQEKQVLFALPDRHILQLGLIAFGCLVCEGTLFDWSGVYFKKVVHAPAALNSLGYAGFMGCMATGRFVADKMIIRFGAKPMLQASGVIITTGLLLAVFYPHIISATAGFMLVGFGVSSVVPIVYSQAGKSKSMGAGQALASVSTVGFAGFLAGPPLIGFIAEATSLQTSFGVVAIIGLGTSLLAGILPSSPKNP